MKTITMTNLLLLASLTLFTACSNKSVEPENEQSVKVSIEDLPLATTYPIEEESYQTLTSQYYVQNVTPQYYSQTQYRGYTTPPPIQNYRTEPRIAQVQYISARASHQNAYSTNTIALTRKIEWDAKKLLGKKYVWGATGPRSYDCSGFTQKIFRDAGIRIPRVSRDQARVGEYVSFNNLRKGDLVFFDTHKKRTGKVTHVGIYLGNGNFIHASSGAKKVVIFNFNEKKFYKERFLWARRVIKDNSYLAMK